MTSSQGQGSMAEELDSTAPCLGCGLRIDGRQDYCAACWDDLLDWLGW
jgi:hypothetical protein